MSDADETPRFPDRLLTEVKRTSFWSLQTGDLISDRDVSELISLLYDHPEDDFYFFKQHDHPTDRLLQSAVDGQIITLTGWKLNFYPHPHFRRDYVQLDKEHLTRDWQRDVILTSPMYVRFELKLTAKARRALEHQQLIAAQKLADRNPIELKPNFMGLGIDVYKAIDWLRAKLGMRT